MSEKERRRILSNNASCLLSCLLHMDSLTEQKEKDYQDYF